MINGITIGIILIFIFLFAGFILTLFISLLLPPLFRTPKEIVSEILELMELEKEDIIIDLGSGDGRLLLNAYAESKCKCFGYDISPIMLILANTRRILRFPVSKDIIFEAEDVFKVDISKATKIYCYLDENGMKILKPKLNDFIKNGGKVFSYRYEIPKTKGKKVELSDGNVFFIYSKESK